MTGGEVEYPSAMYKPTPREKPITRAELRQLAAELTEVDDLIEKIPEVSSALKTLRYVRDCLEDFGAEPEGEARAEATRAAAAQAIEALFQEHYEKELAEARVWQALMKQEPGETPYSTPEHRAALIATSRVVDHTAEVARRLLVAKGGG